MFVQVRTEVCGAVMIFKTDKFEDLIVYFMNEHLILSTVPNN